MSLQTTLAAGAAARVERMRFAGEALKPPASGMDGVLLDADGVVRLSLSGVSGDAYAGPGMADGLTLILGHDGVVGHEIDPMALTIEERLALLEAAAGGD